MNKKGEIGVVVSTLLILIICYGIFWYLPHFSFGWDTGVMTGTIIGYDTKMFGAKLVFVLEDRTIFSEGNGMSQSQVTLCSDFDDTEIHELVEKYINQKVIIEYKERRVGYYQFKYCHEAPITSIRLVDSEVNK